MAYQIQYSPEAFKRYPQVNKTKKLRIDRWMYLMLVVLAVLWLRINGIPDFLIPGDPDITKAATIAFLDDLENGSSVNDAVDVFCREILDGAGF